MKRLNPRTSSGVPRAACPPVTRVCEPHGRARVPWHPIRRARNARACRRGIASLEFVMILPILLLLLFGVMEYGWMLSKAAALNNAARDGARVGARADATSADVTAAVAARMSDAGMSGYTLSISGGAATGTVLTVEIVQPYDGAITLTDFSLIPVPANLRGRVSMRKEGP